MGSTAGQAIFDRSLVLHEVHAPMQQQIICLECKEEKATNTVRTQLCHACKQLHKSRSAKGRLTA